jgi:hypothetical protein
MKRPRVESYFEFPSDPSKWPRLLTESYCCTWDCENQITVSAAHTCAFCLLRCGAEKTSAILLGFFCEECRQKKLSYSLVLFEDIIQHGMLCGDCHFELTRYGKVPFDDNLSISVTSCLFSNWRTGRSRHAKADNAIFDLVAKLIGKTERYEDAARARILLMICAFRFDKNSLFGMLNLDLVRLLAHLVWDTRFEGMKRSEIHLC